MSGVVDEEGTARNVVFSYPKLQASTFAVDCTGRRAVLAVQKRLAVVSLDHSEKFSEAEGGEALRKLARLNKYEIKAVLWNPHMARRQLMVSTCQQKLDIWDVDAERHPLYQSIKAHTRPVCDMSWSFSDPNLLSSCSTDTFIHIWDIREARKPAISFKAVAGATLVQWNRLNGNLVASAHDSDIRIWDRRKPSTASGYITAHMSRIHDLDWCYSNENQLTTCSHDGSVKFWDISSPREPFNTIKVAAQKLWRAKNYPAGKAVALLLVPTMHSGDSRVFLWGQSNVAAPVHIFSGHSEAVLELQWLNSEKLVTWSKDRTLRIWGISRQLKSSLGGGDFSSDSGTSLDESTLHIPMDMGLEESFDSTLSQTVKGDVDPSASLPIVKVSSTNHSPRSYGSPSTRSLSSLPSQQDPASPVFQSVGNQSLAQEFSQLKVENVEIERLEVSQRNCTVKVALGKILVRLGISFPSHYPNGAAPSFIFHQSTSIDINSQHELNRNIFEVATSHVKQNKPCLEACLRCLVKTLESFLNRPQPPKVNTPEFDLFGRLDDEHIPFPRTSGARFSASGLVVCFNNPSGLASDNTKTPRSLDKMNTYKSRIRPPTVRGSSHWTSHTYLSPSISKRSSPGSLASSQGKAWDSLSSGDNPLTAPVTVYDAISILPIDPSLARLYNVSGSDIGEMCCKNAAVASQCGRTDLVQAWSTAALIAEMGLHPPGIASTMPWPRHPFGRNLIKSLFAHFSQLRDVQMLAMLACVFQQHYNQSLENQKKQPKQPHPPQPEPRHQPHPPPLSSSPTLSLPVSSNVNHYSGPTGFTASYTANSYRPNASPPKKVPSQQVSQSPISSSWHNIDNNGGERQMMEDEQSDHEQHCRLLDPVMLRQCGEYHRSYADILYSWQLLDQRAEILKFQVNRSLDTVQQQIGFVNICKTCSDKVKGPSCKKSHSYAFICSICNLSVKGSCNFCLLCGHGGHAQHMLDWFDKYSYCPAGCGCCCLESSGWT